jgi:hypothetical protein
LDNQVLISFFQDFLEGAAGAAYEDPYGQGRIRLTVGDEAPWDEIPATGFADSAASLRLRQIARYGAGVYNAEGGVQEIIAYNPDNRYAYSVNGQAGTLTVISLEELTDDSGVTALTGRDIDVKSLVSAAGFIYGDMTSVAVSPDGTRLAAAIQAEAYDRPGRVAVFAFGENGRLNFLKAYETGVQPDMVLFADNHRILTADEGEPRQGYGAGAVDPKGSVTIVDLAAESVTVSDFSDFDGKRDQLLAAGVVLKKGAAPSVDLEPEYIAAAGGKAYVSLQEANAVAVLDLAANTFEDIYSAGVQDYSYIAVDLDNTSDREGAYTPRYYANTYGLRMPDGIAAYQRDGKSYILTANEGDSRQWGDYLNENEVRLVAADGTETAKKVRMLTEDYEGLPGLGDGSVNYLFGGRSFSLFEAGQEGLTLVYDSGAAFEAQTAAYLPDYFNVSNDDVEKDSRSNKKGPEPESVVTGEINGKTYAFIGLERVGGVMVYEVTDPKQVSFVNYINSRDFIHVDENGIGPDDAPEGLCFVPAGQSPTGEALLLAAFEVSGTVAAYELAPRTAPAKVLKLAVISDDHLYDGQVLGEEGAAFEAYLAGDRKMLRESERILDAAIRRILASDAEYVLVAGDLTKDGEAHNHRLLAGKLAALEQYGKQVFVTNGNHDLSNQYALSYHGSETVSVDTVDREDFREIYAAFGYDQAVARDTDTLSYAVNLGSGHRLIVMDACIYNNDKGPGRRQEGGGAFSEASLNWALAQIQAAIREGRRPIGMMHHGLIPHMAAQPLLFPEYLVNNYETVARTLADAGLGLVFTGHFHSHDVTSVTTPAGHTLYDVETGSLVTYPSPVRFVNIDGNQVSYESVPIEDVAGVEHFGDFAYDTLLGEITDMVPYMLTQVDAGLTLESAAATAETPVAENLSLAQFFAVCMAKHSAGDETPGALAPLIAYFQNYSAGDEAANALYRLLGNIAWALANDTTGDLRIQPMLDTVPDNNGRFRLSAALDPNIPDSEDPAAARVSITGTPDGNGRLRTAPSMAAVMEAIAQAQAAPVSLLFISGDPQVKSLELQWTPDVISRMVQEDIREAVVEIPSAAAALDQKALTELSAQSEGGAATVVIAPANTGRLNDAAQKLLGGRPLMDFAVDLENGGAIDDLGAGALTRAIAYEPSYYERTEYLQVFRSEPDGTAAPVESAWYDSAGGRMVWTGNDFSAYGIGYKKAGSYSGALPLAEKVQIVKTGAGVLQFDFSAVIAGGRHRNAFVEGVLEMEEPKRLLLLAGGIWYDVSGVTLEEAVIGNREENPLPGYRAWLEDGAQVNAGAAEIIYRLSNLPYPLIRDRQLERIHEAYQRLSEADKASIAANQEVQAMLALTAAR